MRRSAMICSMRFNMALALDCLFVSKYGPGFEIIVKQQHAS